MEPIAKKEKFRFCLIWALFNTLAFIVTAIVAFIVVMLIRSAFNIPEEEMGTTLQDTIVGIGGLAVVGLGLGFTQWKLLRRRFRISSIWVYSLAIGAIVAQILMGIIDWKTDIVQSFGENNLVGGTIYISIIVLFIGLVQLPLLSRHFYNIGYWIIASILPGAILISIIAIIHGQQLDWSIPALVGFLMYFICTGATLMWMLKPKIDTNK